MNSESSMKPNIWPNVGSLRIAGMPRPADAGSPDPDHQQPVGAQVNGRAQRRGLPHRAVAEVLLMQEDGAEQERNRQARHQMLEGELHPGALARRAGPGLDRPGAGVESDRIGLRIAGRADAHGPQMLLVHAARDALEMQIPAQQLPQRRVVEQRARRMHQPPPGGRARESSAGPNAAR